MNIKKPRMRKNYDYWKDDYQSKLRTGEELAAMVKSGDKVMMSGGINIPHEMNLALAKRATELQGVTLYMGLALKFYDYMKPEFKPNIHIETPFVGPMERLCLEWGTADYIPLHLNKIAEWMDYEKPNMVCFGCTPPDEYGYMNRSCFGGLVPTRAIAQADIVTCECNPNTPWLMGDDMKVHVSDVDFISESNESLFEIPDIPITDVEQKIASYVAEMVSNGDTIQLGLGGLANAIGYFLRDKRDLGIHTEVIQKSFADLMKRGVCTGIRKNFYPGKACATFCVGDKELWDYVDHNDKFFFTEVEYNNDPYIISQNNNLISVNNALCMDLNGQVGAESIRHQQYSGTGGQMNFMQGVALAYGGKSILTLNSTWKDKEGRLRSTILPFMPPGTIVTSPRTEVQYVVTEYGCVNLRFRDVKERIAAMISIAHPDFREGLRREADKYWK
ncbi:MAG: acetyl-CoA hydrolase/transferase C-terminal domain-containing protein [Syntrophomonadaceae bacterium]|nr:acetyl-CoA hydrolase/transferase C-terminal domain-containing protein [Syntrophomonadaceae bacterium]